MFILIILLVWALGGIAYYFLRNPDNKPEPPKHIDEIQGYNYQLSSNATELLKTEFKVLKTVLESEEIDEEAYVKSISKLFVIDLYTINNKLSKYDIGGLQYVMPKALDNYKVNVMDTIYKYVEDNSDGKRLQNLPEVKSVTIKNISETEMKIDDTIYVGYKVEIEWDYVKDMDYDNKGELTLIKADKYYYVAEKN